ncbi:probable tyrosyl-DNA phosphodiesterase [Chelonus insularis]|uniref:probable tyrosyl-DNA phosphodiesterase n=1 Tax=Chelonus insularis TaxID=460826 RepID=UPI00158E4076|nr:probable tyrosyl-DNA phosphodiesterase [Chelonus insularis]
MSNSSQENNGKNIDKKPCPFKEKCYRKNPIHLGEMSHPHLENLLNGQLTGEIKLPERLDFKCSSKSDLLEQLKVLQLVLKNQQSGTKNITEETSSDVSQQNQLYLKRISESSTSSINNKKIKENNPNTMHQDNTNANLQTSRENKSLFDQFNSCTTEQNRVDIRYKTLEKMKNAGQRIPHLVPLGQFDLKYALSFPYNVFLTCVQRVEKTWDQPYTITFPEILDISLGVIEESLHFNFMVDVGWLCVQYLFAGQKADSLIFLGSRCDDVPLPSNIKIECIKTPTAWGTHHSKVSVLKYTNGGVRIIVSTANLYDDDWDNRTQAVWISPHLPKLSENQDESEGESKTGFKHDFIDYLEQYRRSSLDSWISMIKKLDFSSIDVFFFASVPGSHKGLDRNRWGLRRLATILSNHAELPSDSKKWPVVAQCSSIGSLGSSINAWISQEFMPAMTSGKNKGLKSLPKFQLVYPSINDYKNSFDKQVGSCCLPYSMKVHTKQTWLNEYLYQWKANQKHRSRAMPHSKIYTRISPDLKNVPWIVVTSGNLSKAAWGQGNSSTTILNYEAGVIFLPKLLINEKLFPIREPDNNGTPPFPLPYDLPLTSYGMSNEPFVTDFFTQ